MRTPENEKRADRAAKHIIGYANEHNGGDCDSAMGDLIADIAHFAEDYDGGEEVIASGLMHYLAERDEEE